MEKNIKRKLCIIAFSIYLIILLWAIVFKFNAEWIKEVRIYELKFSHLERIGLEFIPLYKFVLDLINESKVDIDYIMNIIIYFPLGVYLRVFTKLKKKKIILIILLSSFLFEIEQYITAIGGFDGTDIFMNTLGGIIGLYICDFVIKRKIKLINVFNLIVVILGTPLALYAIINTILHFDLYLL